MLLGQIIEPPNSSVESPSFRYLNRMAFHPQIYTNATLLERIDGGYREEIPRFDTENNLISKCIVSIDGSYKLRAYDDDVFTAILMLMEEKGNFDNIESPDNKTDNEIQQMIDGARHLNCYLDEILNIMGIKSVTNNRINLCESLNHQRTITFSFQEIGANGDLISAQTHGIISSISFDSNNLTKSGRITIDDKIIEQIIHGNHVWINFYEYKKVPRGLYRKFFRYLHSLFKRKDSYEIPYDDLQINILGMNYGSDRRNMHEFMQMARWFEHHKLLQYGFSLEKKFRLYNFIESRQDGKWVIIRKGDYFYNNELNPLPSADTLEKTKTSANLKKIGLNKQYEDLYLAACAKIKVSPIKEKARGDKPEIIIYTNPNEPGIILDKNFSSGQKVTEIRPLTWDLLAKYLHFIELFELVGWEKIRSKASFLRSMVEGQKYFSEEKLVEMEKTVKNQKKNSSAQTKPKAKEIEPSFVDHKLRQDKINEEFLNIAKDSLLSADENLVIQDFIKTITVNQRTYDTWFSNVHIIRWNDFIVFCCSNHLGMDWIKSRYLSRILDVIQRKIDKDAKVDVWTKEQFIEDFKSQPNEHRKI